MPPLDVLRKLFATRTGTAAGSGPAGAARDVAVALIDEGNALEEQGRTAEAMARYEAAVQADPTCARAHLNRGNFFLATARIDEAGRAYEQAIACDPRYAAAHFNMGNLNCRVGAYEHALQNYQAAARIKSDFADAFVAMANALDNLGRRREAIESYQRALTINPGYAQVHFNLSVLARSEGQHEQAAASLRKAIELRPDYSEAHHALGTALSSLGQLDAAETCLRRALSIAPGSEQFVYDLALTLVARNRAPEAVQLTVRHLEHAPTWMIKTAFAASAGRVKFVTGDVPTRAALTAAINDPWASPYLLCWPALSLIMLDPGVADCVRRANERWPARPPKAALFGAHDFATLAAEPLLRAVLETMPVTTVEFERFLTAARHTLLETAASGQPADPADTAALQFYAALARQCFINEYVFDCEEHEEAAAAACRARLLALLDANTAVPPLLLLAVAAYFPLYTLPEPERLLTRGQAGPVDDVLRQQIHEPLEERALRAAVARLTPIARGVSERVRDQYEQNPYPRWVRVPRHAPPLHFNAELRSRLPLARFTPLPDDSQPEVLVAGCGTGYHPILLAQAFRGARVLAIDLSLSSIAYAMRKTRELGITNIEYAQADILELGSVGRSFDIIASDGVLHHLADPFAGWRALLSRLRPGGFMHLGLYSQLARRQVVDARAMIASRGYTSTVEDIRRFRRDVTARDAAPEIRRLGERLSRIPDFYSTSECRDWVFHVQEHRLRLDQIEQFLSESGIAFLGFELGPEVLQQYRARFPSDPAGTDLRTWARFEAHNPDTFSSMYQFWVQKPTHD